jgi:hypothetical protein
MGGRPRETPQDPAAQHVLGYLLLAHAHALALEKLTGELMTKIPQLSEIESARLPESQPLLAKDSNRHYRFQP